MTIEIDIIIGQVKNNMKHLGPQLREDDKNLNQKNYKENARDANKEIVMKKISFDEDVSKMRNEGNH